MEIERIIYKKDSRNRIRFLRISTDNGNLIQESGLLDGKKVTHESMCKPKNVGRSNETTSQEQAISEAESTIKKKLDKGYFETIDEAQDEVVIMPMLAHNFKDKKKKVEFPCYAQPKLDGMRCLAHIKNGEVSMVSRGGKLINEKFPHIVNDLGKIPNDIDIILDGELYAHGDDFQRNMELCKKYRPGETEAVKFNVYDVVDKNSYAVRQQLISAFILDFGFDDLFLVPTVEVKGEEELKDIHSHNISEGYEGSMVRWGKAGYKPNGKSDNLLKYKDFVDIAIPIKDVIPNDRNPEHGTPVFDWPGADDDILKAGTKYTHAQRVDLLKNKEEYIGKTAEVRFFEYSNKGVPRHPVMYGIRLDK